MPLKNCGVMSFIGCHFEILVCQIWQVLWTAKYPYVNSILAYNKNIEPIPDPISSNGTWQCKKFVLSGQQINTTIRFLIPMLLLPLRTQDEHNNY